MNIKVMEIIVFFVKGKLNRLIELLGWAKKIYERWN